MSTLSRAIPIALLAAGALAGPLAPPLAAQATVTFDFESTPVGTITPFSVTQGGTTAQFAASDFGQVFEFTPGFMPGMNGHVLGAGSPVHPPAVTIEFSRPATAVSLDFLLTLVGPDPVPMTLEARLGGALVGTASATGVLIPGLVPLDWRQAGPLTFAGPRFDRVTIAPVSGQPNMYLDGVAVQATPEPSAVALLGVGLAAAAAAAYRRNRLASVSSRSSPSASARTRMRRTCSWSRGSPQ